MVEFKAILNKRWCNDLTPKWYAIQHHKPEILTLNKNKNALKIK